MNGYDPRTNQIILEPDASLYVRFHEAAHQEQWQHHGVIFSTLVVARCLRGLNYLATLAIEYDALRRARRVMRKLGIWNEKASNEAAMMFSSYVKRKPI